MGMGASSMPLPLRLFEYPLYCEGLLSSLLHGNRTLELSKYIRENDLTDFVYICSPQLRGRSLGEKIRRYFMLFLRGIAE